MQGWINCDSGGNPLPLRNDPLHVAPLTDSYETLINRVLNLKVEMDAYILATKPLNF
jgi:hypothetical protein